MTNILFKAMLLLSLTSLSVKADMFAEKPSWPLVGEAKLEVLWFDIYDAELYAPEGQYKRGEPLLLTLTYLRDFTAKELIEETQKQWKDSVSSKNIESWSAEVEQFWPDLKAGETLSLLVDEQGQSHFYFEKQFIGSVLDVSFGLRFSDIWLAKDSDFPKLAAKLRGERHD